MMSLPRLPPYPLYRFHPSPSPSLRSHPTNRIESIVPPRTTTHPRTMLACLPHTQTYPILSSLPCHATVRYLLLIPYYGEKGICICIPPNYRPGPTHLPAARGDQITPSVATHVCSRAGCFGWHCHHATIRLYVQYRTGWWLLNLRSGLYCTLQSPQSTHTPRHTQGRRELSVCCTLCLCVVRKSSRPRFVLHFLFLGIVLDWMGMGGELRVGFEP
jgi:hypothetical protein